MTNPIPIDQRVATLEVEAARLAARLTLLETHMAQGLTDLQSALDAVNARRPPVQRRLQDIESRLDAVAPPDQPPPGEGESS